MAIVRCKECDNEFSNQAKACPKCGAPTKKKTSFLTWILVIFIGIWAINIVTNQSTSGIAGAVKKNEQQLKPPRSEYSEQRNLDYRAAALEQIEEGRLLTFTGEVLQIVGDRGLRLATKQDNYHGYSGDDVYLSFDIKPMVLDQDIIRVMGRYDGTFKYKTVLGAERVIPKIRVDYFDIMQTRK
ncbi:MAG: zinc ribbon domain-containing protein [Cyclobacteriaceae bacterium]|nr:zinc ribbon domain-containing protein [Cyclobacteriaceae bacterium]